MGPEPILSSKTSPCPSCGGAVRGDAHWCTLCYADLRPAPAVPAAVPVSAPVTVPAQASWGAAAPDPLTDPLLALFPSTPYAAASVDTLPRPVPAPPAAALGEPVWPCLRCGQTNPMTAEACSGCGGGFLVTARGPAPTLVVPGIGDLAAMSRTKRALVAIGVVALVLLPVLLLTLVTGGGGSGGTQPGGSTVPSSGPSLPSGTGVSGSSGSTASTGVAQ